MCRRRSDEDFAAEIAANLAIEEDRLKGEGLSDEEARAAARRAFGNVTRARERFYEFNRWIWLDDLRQDVAHTVRWLRRNPGFTAVCTVTLTMAIAAVTAVFSLINPLMIRPLPVREPGQLVELLSAGYPGDPRLNLFSLPEYEHFRDQNHVFTEVIGVVPTRLAVAGSGLEEPSVAAEIVTGSFFQVLGVQPEIGRLLEPVDDRAGAPPIAVVSWTMWQRRFGGVATALGQQLVVGGVPVTIVGVASRAFRGVHVGADAQVWTPVSVHPQPGRMLGLIGRLKPGVSMTQAAAEMRVLDRWRIEQHAAKDPQWRLVRLELEPASAGLSPLREQFRSPLLILSAIAATLLLLACANVAGMLLARGETRRQEVALRVALGAGRGRLMRQAAAESALLALAAAALGTAAGTVGAGALLRVVTSGRDVLMMHPNGLEIGVAPDLRVLLFVLSLTALTALACGMAPAFAASLTRPASSLREIGVVGASGLRRALSRSLVVAQVAVSTLLVCAAAMFAAHLDNLRYRDIGFERDSLLLVTLDWSGYSHQGEGWVEPYRELAARLEVHPAIRSVTLSAITPMSAAAGSRFATVPGFVEPAEARRRLSINGVVPNYFQTFGTPLVAGRDFRFEDQAGSRVMIVNASMAAYYFGSSQDALGGQVLFEGDTIPYQIIGVAADAKYRDLREQAPRTAYLNALGNQRALSQLSIRTDGPPAAVAVDVRRAVDDVLKTVTVANVTTMAARMDATIVPERLIAVVSAPLGLLGVLLAATGLYGLMAFTVARRTREIGVRMALGATRRDILTTVFRSAFWLVGTGLLIATPIALASRGLAASAVVNFSAGVVMPLLLASAALLVVGTIAALIPARRAARVDPLLALRRD